MEFESIVSNNDPVYKFKYTTKDRTVLSSPQHKWGVWNKVTKKLELKRMDKIDKSIHELLIENKM